MLYVQIGVGAVERQREHATVIETLLVQVRDSETRQALAECIVALFKRWRLDAIDQAALLGMRSCAPLHEGGPIPDEPMVSARVGHLLAIDRSLHALYPAAPAARDAWIATANEALGSRTPLSVMLCEGLPGILRVREHLDQQWAASRAS